MDGWEGGQREAFISAHNPPNNPGFSLNPPSLLIFFISRLFLPPARPPWSLIAPLRVRSLALDHLTDSAGTYASVPLAKLATYANPS